VNWGTKKIERFLMRGKQIPGASNFTKALPLEAPLFLSFTIAAMRIGPKLRKARRRSEGSEKYNTIVQERWVFYVVTCSF